jgi:peptide/nickel transport system permease protein
MNQESAPSEQEQVLTGEPPAAANAKSFAFLGRGLSFLFSSPIAVIGLAIVLFWVTVAVFAPFLTSYTPYEQDWRAPNQGPSREHILGTDELGRDLWSRLIYGARIVLVILPISETFWLPGGTAVWGVLVALMAGVALGLVSGYYGGWIDEVVMRLLDAMMAVPIILLFLLIMSALGQSAVNIVIAMTIVGTPGIARLVRSLTMDIRTREFIRAAETRGESPWHIMFIEILPNARGPIIVDAMLRVGYAIFAMGTLGFLGLGLPPPSPDWGSMVAKGREFIMAGSPWAAMWPSIAIASLVVGLNLFADGIREETMRYQ